MPRSLHGLYFRFDGTDNLGEHWSAASFKLYSMAADDRGRLDFLLSSQSIRPRSSVVGSQKCLSNIVGHFSSQVTLH